MAALSFKNLSTAADVYSIVSDLNFGGALSYIKLCLNIATLMWDCIKTLQGVPDKDKEDMLQNVKSLKKNLQNIEHLQLQYALNDQEIETLYSQLQSIKGSLEYLNDHAKKNWLQKLWSQLWSKTSVKGKFSAMKAKMNEIVQNSTLIVTTLNLELTASLERKMSLEHKKVMSELEKIKAELGGLENKMTSEHNALTLQLSAVIILKYDYNGIKDNSITSPHPPKILYIKETKGTLFVKWQTLYLCNKIDFFALCYDEEEKASLKFPGNIYEATIGPPEVELIPEKLYTVKICGVRAGIQGKWSNSVVQKFTKPCPRQPDAPKISSINSSTVKFTVTPPKPVCPTESPVMKWEIEYAIQSDRVGTKEWTQLDKFQVEHEEETMSLDITLASKQTYCFRVKAKNAEGWSAYSKAVSFEMTHSHVSSMYVYFHTAVVIILMAFLLFLYMYKQCPWLSVY